MPRAKQRLRLRVDAGLAEAVFTSVLRLKAGTVAFVETKGCRSAIGGW